MYYYLLKGADKEMSSRNQSQRPRSRGHPVPPFVTPSWIHRSGPITDEPNGPWNVGPWSQGRDWTYGKENLGCGNGLGHILFYLCPMYYNNNIII